MKDTERFARTFLRENPMVLGCLLVLIIAGILVLVQPYFEMRAFNRFSEKKATYWDAAFASLRVMAK